MRKSVAYGLAALMAAGSLLPFNASSNTFGLRNKPLTEAAAQSGNCRLSALLVKLKKSAQEGDYARMARIARRMLRHPASGKPEGWSTMNKAATVISGAVGKAGSPALIEELTSLEIKLIDNQLTK